MRIDRDRAFVYGASAAGDRFRYALIREGGAWRLDEMREPENDARVAAERWAAASGSEICQLLTERLARSLYGSREQCVLDADAQPAAVAISSIDLTPRSLDDPATTASVGGSFGGREIWMRVQFARSDEIPDVDEVVDAQTGEPVRR